MNLVFDGSSVNILIALIAGVVTFFASCLLPLVPTYLAYLAGIATSRENTEQDKKIIHRKIFINGLIFTLGFILVFVFLGATSQTIGLLLNGYKSVIRQLGGVLFVLMGLFMLDFIKIQTLYKERKLNLPSSWQKYRELNSFIVGMAFGFAWTPCIGPVLAVILFWASQAETLAKGTELLLAYGIGLGIPFVVTAYFFEKFSHQLIKTKKVGRILHHIAAWTIIFMGLLLIFEQADFVAIKLIQLFNLSPLSI